MTCEEYRKAVFDRLANPYDMDHHVESCLDCVRWQEERMDAEDLARGVMTAVPTLTAIPGAAAIEIEGEARDRLNKTNAHLRRTVAEVHKMMIWHQYAAAALQGLCAQGVINWKSTLGDCTHAANVACSAADSMMEQIRQRKIM